MSSFSQPLVVFLFLFLWTPWSLLFAANAPTKVEVIEGLSGMAREINDFEHQLAAAIATGDDTKIKPLIKSEDFVILAMSKPNLVMLTAVQYKNYLVMDALLRNDANINTELPIGIQTVLHYAVWLNDPKMVTYLLSHGIDAFRIDEGYCTALDEGLRKGRTACVAAILEHEDKIGLLNTYMRWESELTEIRIKLRGLDFSSATKERDLLLQMRKLSQNGKQ